MADYDFGADWFSGNVAAWQRIFTQRQPPEHALEIGSYEGRSTVWIIEHLLAPRQTSLVAIDNWEEGPEPDQKGMAAVEARFDHNMRVAKQRYPSVAVGKCKGHSVTELARLLANGKRNFFDFIYLDGNHVATAVLPDLVLAFHLCKVGGLIFCDDYLWHQHRGLVETPKLAIDSFLACFHFKVNIIPEHLYQIYLHKISE